MKTALITLFLMVMCVTQMQAQSQTLKVTQDAYVQGGATAYDALGIDDANNLKVMVSDDDSKYARTTYMQFSVKKGQGDFESAVLSMHAKIFEPKVAGTTFKLSIYAVEDDKWSEGSLTHKQCPEAVALVAHVELESHNGEAEWVEIPLDVAVINSLFNVKKDKKISLVLKNQSKDGIGMIISSKDKTWSGGQDAKSGAYITVK